MYLYKFYRFPSSSQFIVCALSAGWTQEGDNDPVGPFGSAVDVIGQLTDPFPEGWYVNVAWNGEEAPEFAPYSIPYIEGLRAFAGWNTPEPPAPVPNSVTVAQCRIMLVRRGLFDQVNQAIQGIGGEALVVWEYGNEIQRRSPMVEQLTTGFGWTDAFVDECFREAGTILV